MIAASQIVDTSMVGTEMLNDIEMETVNIHTLATGSYYIDRSIIND